MQEGLRCSGLSPISTLAPCILYRILSNRDPDKLLESLTNFHPSFLHCNWAPRQKLADLEDISAPAYLQRSGAREPLDGVDEGDVTGLLLRNLN